MGKRTITSKNYGLGMSKITEMAQLSLLGNYNLGVTQNQRVMKP
jgi:hypothetical protein